MHEYYVFPVINVKWRMKDSKPQIEWIYTAIDLMNNSSLTAQVYLFICIPRISLQNVDSEGWPIL